MLSNDFTNSSCSSDTVSSSLSSVLDPQFRIACEECHIRKIRCEPSLGGSSGSCVACQLNERRCLFSLRNKIGRPRKTGTKSNSSSGSSAVSDSPNVSQSTQSFVHEYHQRNQEKAGSRSEPASSYSSRPTWLKHSPSLSNSYPTTTSTSHGQERNHTEVYNGHPRPYYANQRGSPLQLSTFSDYKPLSGNPGDLSPISTSFFNNSALDANQNHFWSNNQDLDDGNPHTSLNLSQNVAKVDSLTVESWLMPNQAQEEDAKVETSTDFLGALELCREIHRQCDSKRLSFLAETDQEEIGLLLRTFNELSNKTSMLFHEPMVPTNRSEQSKSMIILVAVMEAIEVCGDLLEFNINLNGIYSTSDERSILDYSDGFANSQAQESVGYQTLAQLPLAQAYPVDNKALDLQLKSIVSLNRLDFCLFHFRMFLSGFSSPTQSEEDSSPPKTDAPFLVGDLRKSLSRLQVIHQQIEALLVKFRSFWNEVR